MTELTTTELTVTVRLAYGAEVERTEAELRRAIEKYAKCKDLVSKHLLKVYREALRRLEAKK